ncbi:glycerol kinase GlpK [Acidilobus sp.]|uniref:glycerol kinase GlpK n=1 Tax=Acidilobus sp. TaxID=1872109 RepID=UPI003D0232AF
MDNENKQYVLSLDEGTTSARAIVFDRNPNILGIGQYEFPQYYPKPGWVEHNPEEIWDAQLRAIRAALENSKVDINRIAAIGVTNQRETTILWDKATGKPIYNAIVWQCRRTADRVEELKREYFDAIKSKTGLIPDAYFSGTKIEWLLNNVPGAREKARKGEILFGTIDTYLIWKLTGGKAHVIDYSNASRTMIFNINKLEWDSELLEILNIPEEILPEPVPSSSIYGYSSKDVLGAEIPIAGDAGDQQAALFGQACYNPGMVKNTYGTGNFVLMNTGNTPYSSKTLLTTIAWGLSKNRVEYALEGSIFITGAAVQWLRDGLKLFETSDEIEPLATSISSNEDVYFVPAFVGLGAPYWDQYARGLIIGITRGTKQAHLARAVLEAEAYLVKDVLDEMEKDSGIKVKELRVDGGAVKNNFLMQFQADILGINVVRPVIRETTALGAAYLAGLATGVWKDTNEIASQWRVDRVFTPQMERSQAERLYSKWKEAVKRSLGWAKV